MGLVLDMFKPNMFGSLGSKHRMVRQAGLRQRFKENNSSMPGTRNDSKTNNKPNLR